MKVKVGALERALGLCGIGELASERAQRIYQRTEHNYLSAARVSMSAVGLSWKRFAR
jgi:hypothetical protein